MRKNLLLIGQTPFGLNDPGSIQEAGSPSHGISDLREGGLAAKKSSNYIYIGSIFHRGFQYQMHVFFGGDSGITFAKR